ncbi:hypothetical protein [Lacticaseibacillus nasuensis]|uniref:hypothetical protein n=1 Tax=Lacticaseibacillus nasuensis TaxID=944671 RepID=UPI0006D27CFD
MIDTIFIQPGQVAIENIEKPTIQAPDDVMIYILLDAVLNGKIHSGKVFTKTFALTDINVAYQAMAKTW